MKIKGYTRVEAKPEFVDIQPGIVYAWEDEKSTKENPIFRTIEKAENGEILEYRIYGYSLPECSAELEEIYENITSGDPHAIEQV